MTMVVIKKKDKKNSLFLKVKGIVIDTNRNGDCGIEIVVTNGTFEGVQ